MTRTRFHLGLEELKQKLVTMGGLAEQAVHRATQAYSKRDGAICHQVLDAEPQINRIEREIDELARELLAMQQPMAVDLRFILAVIKINADLERVGDQAVNIAQHVLDIIKLPPHELPVDIPKMASVAAQMVHDALQAFVLEDPALAHKVLATDDLLDRMNREANNAIAAKMQASPEMVNDALDALLIARNLERIGDHATNISEDVIFWVQGADVRHQPAPTQSAG
jgi:phosphate transport system protein